MRRRVLASLLGVALGIPAISQAQDSPRLWVMGQQVSFGNTVTVTLASDATGEPALIALGLDPLPLDAPIVTGHGPFFMGNFLMPVIVGIVPATGRIDIPFTLPAYSPLLDKLHVVLQGYVAGTLSNPASIPLVEPYFSPQNVIEIPPPMPQQAAAFGDRIATGDFNADGIEDLAIGAWFETVAGQLAAGRVYVLWGPDFQSFLQFSPPTPKFAETFGASVMADDLDGDGIDDLVIGEGPGEPPTGSKGRFYVYHGGIGFSPTASLVVPSAGAGSDYTNFGRSAALGDLNDDGYPEIVAGVTNATNGSLTWAGRVDVYFGPDYVVRQPISSPEPGQNDFFGSKLAVGDVNGDGVLDLIEGSGRVDVGGEINIGRCHVFYGPGLSTYVTIECPMPAGFNTRFGDQVSGMDINGDGLREVVVHDDLDRAYIFWAPAISDYAIIKRPLDSSEVGSPTSAFGYELVLGDINLDGILDIILPDVFRDLLPAVGLLGLGGYVYVALEPHFAVFDRIQDTVIECGAEFGWEILFDDGALVATRALLVGSPFRDSASIINSGRVIVFR